MEEDVFESNENDSDSDSLDEDLEAELYSVLHYNSFSNGIPSELLSKYNISRSDENEFYISLKKEDPIEENKGAPEKEVLSEISKQSELTKRDNVELQNISPGSKSPIIELSSDDDCSNSSDIVLIKNTMNDSIVLSDSTDTEDLVLNTSNTELRSGQDPEPYRETSPVQFSWTEVVSPATWTDSMKKYYNKPCKSLKYFDHIKIRNELKGKGGDWSINVLDQLCVKKRVVRCNGCRQVGHLLRNCPRKQVNCHVCGFPDHHPGNCPFRMCLNCGKPNPIFVQMCNRCTSKKHVQCNECKQFGHMKDNCPDLWRRYHSTTSGSLEVKPHKLNENLMCCNCGRSGHLFEDCRALFWSLYPPTSFLVKSTSSAEPQPSPQSAQRNGRTNKRIKFSNGFHSNSSSPDFTSPTFKKKKFKGVHSSPMSDDNTPRRKKNKKNKLKHQNKKNNRTPQIN